MSNPYTDTDTLPSRKHFFFFSIPTFKSAFKPHESSMQPLHIKSATLYDYKIS